MSVTDRGSEKNPSAFIRRDMGAPAFDRRCRVGFAFSPLVGGAVFGGIAPFIGNWHPLNGESVWPCCPSNSGATFQRPRQAFPCQTARRDLGLHQAAQGLLDALLNNKADLLAALELEQKFLN